jgi:hypothetical protein
VPEPAAMLPSTSVSAATDINIGTNALGFLLSDSTEAAYCFIVTRITTFKPSLQQLLCNAKLRAVAHHL